MSVLLAKNIDVNKLKYSEVKILKSGAKSVYVNYDGSKLMLQTPILNLPYGVNDSSQFIKDEDKKDKKDEEKKYDITLSFKGQDENPKIKQFHDKLKDMEQKVIEDAYNNRLLWFKNNYNNNKDVVSNMFTPMVKHDKDKVTGEIANKYPPTFRVKAPYNAKDDKFEFDCYDMDNNEVEFANILNNLKGGKAQLIIQLNGIWFSGGMFGCSWKIVSGKFQQSNATKVTFIVDSDVENEEEDEEEDDISVDEDVVKKSKEEKPVEEEEEDVDEEEDVEEERPPTPEPVKPVVKKAVKKAK
jgi:ribosomal protein S17E